MKTKLHSLIIVLALLAGVHQATAQGTRFFRIAGPAANKITAFRADGSLVWTNAHTGTNYTVQTVAALPGGTNWVDYVQLPVTNRVNTNQIMAFNPPAGMTLIPAGIFTLGDTLDGETDAVPTNMTVSAFYMDVNLVSYSQWQAAYNWATNHGYSFDYAGAGKATNHPAQTIDWYDCVKWCNARSEMEGKTPAYYTNAAQTVVYRSGQVNVDNSWVNWNSGYRLPTEAEWEKAARGGLSGQRFPWGDTISESQANYDSQGTNVFAYDLSNTGYNPTFYDGIVSCTSPAGYFAANGYGLHDMAGNVWQWCWDWSGSYGSGSQSNPRGPTSGANRVLRGGSWLNDAFSCRSADRYSRKPTYYYLHVGFRSVLSPGQ